MLRDMCYVTCMSGVLKNVCRANTHLEFILHKQYIDIVYNFVHFCRFVNCKLGNIAKKWVFLVKFEKLNSPFYISQHAIRSFNICLLDITALD